MSHHIDPTSLELKIEEEKAYERKIIISECATCNTIVNYQLYYGSTLKYEGQKKPENFGYKEEISHTICEPCARIEYAKIGLDYDKIHKKQE